ncbi:UDP-galactopyranose mutase [Pseudoflavonifractor sp. 60]|uniref:UDP-galactopyranose mutase n=1 Tax=Pseudoflavonifractor sp. 60 TaxID=2304576 RepID=UPI001368694B|nr:UDP-galactopyranose mutase [Pseudoflavonifractor sp. 60]NBI68193.1 UDP-galactopyranose mutase [Pseudoflavonifractor sp. 60]
MEKHYDLWIAGAGYAGAVAARALAEKGRRVLVLERRDHIGGNAYDCLDGAGVLIHKYGPHIFHTNDKKVFDWLSRFTQWRNYQHRVVANIPDPEGGGKPGWRLQYPVPFNLTSLETAFGAEEGRRLGDKLVAAYGAEKKVTILELRQNPDPEIAALADYVYEHVFVRYTMKQWGQKPEDIDPNTTARVPVFLSRDDRYFQDAYQGMPLEGYTKMFQRMLDHPNIEVRLNTDVGQYLALEEYDIRRRETREPLGCPLIYTGPLDEFFNLRYGRLPYRTLDFQFETWQDRDYSAPHAPYPDHPLRGGDFYQTHTTVNYTMDEEFTRITEFKRLTGQDLPGVTTIVKEYARAYTGAEGEIPYYAVINPENNALYARYKAEADKKKDLHLLGRLAEYKYYNMDAIAARALELAERL